MQLKERIELFSALGNKIKALNESELNEICEASYLRNPWFTKENTSLSLKSIAQILTGPKLKEWINPYPLTHTKGKKVGIAMAGNIPLVGFHDMLCVLMGGHEAHIKLSSQDNYLLPKLTMWLKELNPDISPMIQFHERLNHVEAIIATGSDNTSRYFEYYFRNIPQIIRKNRSSIAVLMGEENHEDLIALAPDIFTYYGLGCRNISKVYVPEDYNFSKLYEALENYKDVIHHHKYANNYDYQKSILLVNKIPFLDNGFLLVTQNTSLVSPISVVYYETYTNQDDLANKISSNAEKIQCIVSAKGWLKNSVSFGQAQFPELNDYADGVNTIKFLTTI